LAINLVNLFPVIVELMHEYFTVYGTLKNGLQPNSFKTYGVESFVA